MILIMRSCIFEWWNSKIQTTKIPSESKKQIFSSDLTNFDTKLLRKIRYKSKLKKFLYYYNRIRYYLVVPSC